MARKTKGGASRRPGQQRPRAATPPRRVATAQPASEPSIEERLAELERERERLLAVAQGLVPSEEADTPAGDTAEPAGDGATEEEERPAAAPGRSRVTTLAQPAASGARRVGRVVPTAAPVVRPQPKSAVRAADALDPTDPSIPLERVPYVSADLRRVGVIAGLMIVLIVIADFVVRAVVK